MARAENEMQRSINPILSGEFVQQTLWSTQAEASEHLAPPDGQQPVPVLHLASAEEMSWVQVQVTLYHYRKTPVSLLSKPLAYIVLLHGRRIGCLIFGRPENTETAGWFSGDLQKKLDGSCRLWYWEVLCLLRIWFHEDVQVGGSWHRPGIVPGFFDRNGDWHSNLASTVIERALDAIVIDYLLAFPPCFPELPYQLAEVLSYCDTTQPRHRGTVYQQSGFHLVRENDAGLQTYARAVRPLTWGEDAYVQYFADRSLRSRRYRSRRQSERAARQLAFQTDTASFEAPRLAPSL